MSVNIKKNNGTICAAINCTEYSNLTKKVFHRFPTDDKRYLYLLISIFYYIIILLVIKSILSRLFNIQSNTIYSYFIYTQFNFNLI